MRNALLLLILSIFLLSCSTSHYDFDGKKSEAEIIQELEKILAEELPKDRSISGAILKGDKVIWSKAYGVADLKIRQADTSTIYRIGSISKPVTAFLMMLLVQDSIIKLNDPVELYLPEIKKLKGYSEATKITFEQLATHTSGLIREPGLENAASGPIEGWESKIIEAIPTTTFESKPGEKFSYSNIGYGILGLAISKAAHKPFMELVETRIFEPLAMNSSYFVVPKEKMSNLAMGIDDFSDGEPDTKTPLLEHKGRGYKVPNGGIYTTPNDLAKFMRCMTGTSNALLSNENLAKMKDKLVSIGEQNFYGIGFFINQNEQLTVVNHGGAVAGYTANFAFAKESEYGILLLRNYSKGDPDIWQLSLDLLDALSKVEKEN